LIMSCMWCRKDRKSFPDTEKRLEKLRSRLR
jgi:hypothetical protein